MRKNVLKGILSSFMMGISIGYVITVISSLLFGNGAYIPCNQVLYDMIDSEIGAVTVQTLVCGSVGTLFYLVSFIWNMDNISIAKQTFLYYVMCIVIMFPAAYLMHWAEHSFLGFLIFFVLFTVFFFIVWIVQYVFAKSNIEKINKCLEKV